MTTKNEVLKALSKVNDPEIGKDLVTLGMISDIEIKNGEVEFKITLTTPACPLKKEIQEEATKAVMEIQDVEKVDIKWGSQVRTSLSIPDPSKPLEIKNIIAVASGKGGVGKSTMSVYLALALNSTGAKVGILDADIYGPSIPTMMGVNEKPVSDGKMIQPINKYDLKLMSMGFISGDKPVIWRGPMLAGAIRQFVYDVKWGDLDYLVVDLPPGTGDASLSLAQMIPLTGVVIVTTPQDAALGTATKALHMFKNLNVKILGLIENMSYFECPTCKTETNIFSHGGGKNASQKEDVEFLGSIPIDTEIRTSMDIGKPLITQNLESEVSVQFIDMAKRLAGKISIEAFRALPVIE